MIVIITTIIGAIMGLASAGFLGLIGGGVLGYLVGIGIRALFIAIFLE